MKHTQTECKPWNGAIDSDGYGRFQCGKSHFAHRVAFESHIGIIPKGMVIDHLCRNRACVNTEHMEVVTPKENTLRGYNPMAINARKTTCIRGHELDAQDNKGNRQCKTCRRERWKAYRLRKIAAGDWNDNRGRTKSVEA